MKKILFLSLLAMPFISKAQFTITNSSTLSLLQVRDGDWPVELQRVIKETDTCYVLEFRDQQYLNFVVMDTLEFENIGQLRYFSQALSYLKKGHDGDQANFSNYSIKRTDKRYGGGTWYMLKIKFGLADFQQPEADVMCKTITGLR